jgi:hypothetical protein
MRETLHAAAAEHQIHGSSSYRSPALRNLDTRLEAG